MSVPVPSGPPIQPTSSSLRVAAWSAIGAGVAGLLGLVSTLPWPELFSVDAVPSKAIVVDPGLFVVLIGHYGTLAAGGALGLLAGVMFSLVLRRRRPAAAAALLVAAGAGLMGYAAGRRAIDVALHDGRSPVELETLVWSGGAMLLVGTWSSRWRCGARRGWASCCSGSAHPSSSALVPQRSRSSVRASIRWSGG